MILIARQVVLRSSACKDVDVLEIERLEEAPLQLNHNSVTSSTSSQEVSSLYHQIDPDC